VLYVCPQIIQLLVHQNKCFRKVNPACREPDSLSSKLTKLRDSFLPVLYNASEENALEQHSVECEKH